MNNHDLLAMLEKMGACGEIVEFVGEMDLSAAWNACERSDWMLRFLAENAGTPGWPTMPEVIGLTCDCVESSLRHVSSGDDVPRLAIAAARRWADEPTPENAAAAWVAGNAVSAAGYVAIAAGNVAWAAGNVARAARYATWAAGEPVWAEHKKMCDLIRAKLPEPYVVKKEI